MLQDLRFVIRLARKHPAPVGIAVLGLAVAIGVVTSVFTIVNAAVLRPYGMDDPSSVYTVGSSRDSGWPHWPYERFLQFRSLPSGQVEASVSATARFGLDAATESADSRAIRFVSGGYLPLLGGRPAIGRVIGVQDDRAGAPPVVMLSHAFWTHHLAADPAMVGRSVWINGVAATVVGVLPAAFTGPIEFDRRPAIWAPLSAYDELRAGPAFDPSSRAQVEVLVRVPPDVATWTVQDQLSAMAGRPLDTTSAGAAPETSHLVPTEPAVMLLSAATPMSGRGEADVMFVVASVAALSGLVLALACGNAAHLLMAAAVTRAREMGVRLALGASRRRLVRQLVTESLLLGLVAGALGLAVTVWTVPLFASIASLPADLSLHPDARVWFFALAAGTIAGLGAGMAPARFGAGGHVLSALKGQAGALSTSPNRRAARLRRAFVAGQAGVSMILLVLASLLARSAWTMNAVEIGFDADRLAGVTLEPLQRGVDHPSYLQAAVDAVRALPSVEHVSVTRHLPFGVWRLRRPVTVGTRTQRLLIVRADAAFLATAGIPLVGGRAFTEAEVAREADVAVISQRAARALVGDANPIGQWLSFPAGRDGAVTSVRVVGVAADAMLQGVDVDRDAAGTLFQPLERSADASAVYTDQGLIYPPSLLVRAADAQAVAPALEDALRRVDARVRPSVTLVAGRVEARLQASGTLAWVTAVPAVLALLLAALGVYGVTSFAVSQRTAEVGLRLAIGASAGDVIRLLARDGLRPVLTGLVVGLAIALVVSRIGSTVLPGVSPHDPVAIAAAVVTLLGGSIVAIITPALRASRLDPARVLRQ